MDIEEDGTTFARKRCDKSCSCSEGYRLRSVGPMTRDSRWMRWAAPPAFIRRGMREAMVMTRPTMIS